MSREQFEAWFSDTYGKQLLSGKMNYEFGIWQAAQAASADTIAALTQQIALLNQDRVRIQGLRENAKSWRRRLRLLYGGSSLNAELTGASGMAAKRPLEGTVMQQTGD